MDDNLHEAWLQIELLFFGFRLHFHTTGHGNQGDEFQQQLLDATARAQSSLGVRLVVWIGTFGKWGTKMVT